MIRGSTKRPLLAVALGLVLGVALLSTGCSSVGYYARSVGGHLAIVGSARPVTDWIADPTTPPAMKERLALSQRIRDFAVTELEIGRAHV